MTRKLMNRTGIALALATALFLLTSAALAGPNTNSRCYQIYDWYTGMWKTVCFPW